MKDTSQPIADNALDIIHTLIYDDNKLKNV